MPPPGDQGAQGSCAAWAAGYALKGYQENVERSWGVAGPAHRFSPAYIYNQIKRSGCDEGARLTDALDLLAQQGCATLEQMPYDDGDCAATPTPAVKAQAAEYRIAAYQRVDITDAEEMKSHLAAGLPVVVGVKVYASFLGLSGSAVYATASGPFKGLHAMAVVGYDDASASFKLMNSWSTGWGDGGYVRISYDLFPSLLKEAYVAEDLQAGKRNLTTATQGAGRVLLSPPGGVYAPGSVVEVRAAPDPGWAFDHWEGDAHGSTTPAHVTMDADRTVVAVFGEQLPTQAAAPGFSPPGGTTFLDSLDVTLSSPTSGATIRYTLDGSAPSPTKGTVYAGPVHLTASATIKALAYASGLSPSVVASASYTKKEGHFDVDGAAVALWYLNGNGADATGHGHDLAIKSDRVTWSSAGALTWASSATIPGRGTAPARTAPR
ncbi:MAG: C1 family peptidase [Minicystis sp.]